MTISTGRGAPLKTPSLLESFLIQSVVLMFASLLCWWWMGSTTAYSVLLGGVICVVPNIFFVRWAFRFAGARAAAQVTQSFYIGETGKFIFTVVLFASVFAWVKPLNTPVLFLSYIVILALNWMLALRALKAKT